MMGGPPFAVVTGLLYPFAVVAALTGVASWLARHRGFSEFVRGRSDRFWLRDGVIAGLILCLGALLSFRPIPHFAALVGFFGSLRASSAAGAVLGGFMLLVGWPWQSAMVCLASAPLGRLVSYAGRASRPILVLWGGALVPLSWSLGWIPEVSFLHVKLLSPVQLKWMACALSLGSAMQTAVLLWVLDYLARREERRGADVLWRMSETFDGILTALREPLPNSALCRAVSTALRADCLVMSAQREVCTSTSTLKLTDEIDTVVGEVLVWGQPSMTICSQGRLVAIPLDDGEERLGALVLPIPDGHPLASASLSLLRALGAFFTSELASQRIQRQQSDMEQVRYRMLAAQIRPHFLFNSLTSVASLTMSQPQQAHDLLLELARSLRHRFASVDDWTTLGNEMDSVYSYLGVEKARYGERLQIAVDVPCSLFAVRVPSMTIQPLIENAVRHGVVPDKHEGLVRLKATLQESWLEVTVEDDGLGFGREIDGDGEGLDLRSESSGTMVGLANVRQRLRTLVGQECGFRIQSTPGQGTVIGFRVPVSEAETEELTEA